MSPPGVPLRKRPAPTREGFLGALPFHAPQPKTSTRIELLREKACRFSPRRTTSRAGTQRSTRMARGLVLAAFLTRSSGAAETDKTARGFRAGADLPLRRTAKPPNWAQSLA